MPTYEYACDACGHQLEVFQAIKDEPLRKCPACGRRRLRRLIGAGAAILFKGSGFYQTDYRSQSYKEAAKNDKPPDSASSDKKAKDTSSKAAAS